MLRRKAYQARVVFILSALAVGIGYWLLIPSSSRVEDLTLGSREDLHGSRADGNTVSGHEPVKLTYATWGSPNEEVAQKRIVAKFMEKYPWIHLNYLYVPGDYVTKLTTLYASNKAPDVFVLYKNTALQWAEQGMLYNLHDFLVGDGEINEESLIPNSVMYWAKDKVAGIKAAEESFALYYNVDMFRQAGVPLPPARAEEAWSWDQFVDNAKRLTIDRNGHNGLHPDFDPKQIEQFGVRFDSWMWQLLVPSNNTSIIANDGSGLNLQDPAVIDAVQKLADLIYVHHVAPSPVQEKTLPAPSIALQSRKAAMDLNGQWVQLDLAAAKVNYGVGVLPKLKTSKTIQFGEPVVISSTTKHPEEAWLFIKWLLNAEDVIDMHASGLWMPTIKEYYTNPELIAKWAQVKPGHADGYEEAVMRQTLENGVSSYDNYLKNIERIKSVMNVALDQIWLGQATVADAFASIADKVDAEFKGTYNFP